MIEFKIMHESGKDVPVGRRDDDAVHEERIDRPDIDGFNAVGDREGNNHNDDRRNEVHELWRGRVTFKVHEPQDVGRIIVRMHKNVGPLINWDRHAEGRDTNDW